MNRLLSLVLSASLLCLGACGESRSAAAKGGPADAGFMTADGRDVGEIRLSGDPLLRFTTASGTQTLKVIFRDNSKRKYADGGGTIRYEVKPGDDSFKLRTAQGTLLWKLKTATHDKLLIADNEEAANPVVLRMETTRVSVEDQGRKLGEVSFDAAASEASVTDASGTLVFRVRTSKLSAAFGLLLAARIPPAERTILQAELLAAGH